MIQEAQTAAATAAPVASDAIMSSQLAMAALLAYFLQWIKATKLIPWVSEHTVGINRVLTGVLSLVAAVGINYSFDTTSGTFTITGLHASTLLPGLWKWAQQWVLQQGATDMIFAKQVAKEQAEAESLPMLTKGTGDGK